MTVFADIVLVAGPQPTLHRPWLRLLRRLEVAFARLKTTPGFNYKGIVTWLYGSEERLMGALYGTFEGLVKSAVRFPVLTACFEAFWTF